MEGFFVFEALPSEILLGEEVGEVPRECFSSYNSGV